MHTFREYQIYQQKVINLFKKTDDDNSKAECLALLNNPEQVKVVVGIICSDQDLSAQLLSPSSYLRGLIYQANIWDNRATVLALQPFWDMLLLINRNRPLLDLDLELDAKLYSFSTKWLVKVSAGFFTSTDVIDGCPLSQYINGLFSSEAKNLSAEKFAWLFFSRAADLYAHDLEDFQSSLFNNQGFISDVQIKKNFFTHLVRAVDSMRGVVEIYDRILDRNKNGMMPVQANKMKRSHYVVYAVARQPGEATPEAVNKDSGNSMQ